jgi:putative oxidoreductase
VRASLGLAVLRLALAVVFVAHGANKLFGVWAGPGIGPGGLDTTATSLAALGLHPEFPLAVLAGLAQLGGGLLLGLGLFTRVAAAGMIGYLIAGAWWEQAKWGLFLNWIGTPGRGHGLEYSLVLAGALGCLVLTGSGDWSIDGLRANSAASRAAGRARLRGKM